MNRHAYLSTGLFVRALSALSKANINIYDQEKIPRGSIIFVVNHFTRIETLFLPLQIYNIINVPVWSLADHTLFKGAFGNFLDNVGALSTKDPDRDSLMVKTLLTNEAVWIIFPEGRMVKNKKIVEKGQFMISYAGGKHPPHTGAATLALRTEFYRQRLGWLLKEMPQEAKRLMDLFKIEAIGKILDVETFIVPVNMTYYPIRAKENILSNLANRFIESPSERLIEEIMAEGTMLFSGVDVDIRFASPIRIKDYIDDDQVKADVSSRNIYGFDDPIPSKAGMRRLALHIMDRYMSSIYGMTTVNHDHLFATMFKSIPFLKFSEADLRRRVFLIACQNLSEKGVHVHRSLLEEQTHLLTDDRFRKYHDFITLASEKGICKVENGKIIKNIKDLSKQLSFDRARLMNPIEVIANEVEPLTNLLNEIRKLTWLPSFYIKRKIVQHLLIKCKKEYEEDYETFFEEDFSKSKNVGEPFLVKGSSKKIGVILIHGYLATPGEVKKLAFYLGKRGFWVYVPRIKGHGTSPLDLASRSYKEWITSIDQGYSVISNICHNVVAGGFSTGAGLALDLASRIPSIKGVFAVSPPMQLQDFSAKFAPAVDVWNRLMKMIRLDSAKRDFLDNHPENIDTTYTRNPVAGIKQLENLMEYLAPRLSLIKMPTIILQAHNDPVVDPKGAQKVFQGLSSKDKKFVQFNFDRHGILNGEGSEDVHLVIGDFIDRVRGFLY